MNSSNALRINGTSSGYINYSSVWTGAKGSNRVGERRGYASTQLTPNALNTLKYTSSSKVVDDMWARIKPYAGTESKCKSRVISKELWDNLQKIARIGQLGYNWNGNNAEPFTKKLLDNVRVLLMNLNTQPEVFPTAADSIQLEYDGENGSYLEFQIYEKEKVDVFLIDRCGDEIEWEVDLAPDTINSIVGKFYG